jgi:hypothetical protein
MAHRFIVGMLLLFLAHCCSAQFKIDTTLRNDALSNNVQFLVPGPAFCDQYYGVSTGMTYNRFLGRSLSLSFGFNYLIWAGTAERGEYFSSGYRAGISAYSFAPGLGFFPFGYDRMLSLYMAGNMHIGRVTRTDTYRPNNTGHTSVVVERAFLLSPEIEFGINIRPTRRFIVTLYGSWGPMLACGSRTEGNLGFFGLRLGKCF